MQTATTPQTQYTGPLGRFLAKQAEARQAAVQHQAELARMRRNIMALVEDADLFTDVERLRCNDNIFQSESLPRLQTWFRNVYRVYQERQQALPLAFTDGTRLFLPLTTPAPIARPLMWIA